MNIIIAISTNIANMSIAKIIKSIVSMTIINIVGAIIDPIPKVAANVIIANVIATINIIVAEITNLIVNITTNANFIVSHMLDTHTMYVMNYTAIHITTIANSLTNIIVTNIVVASQIITRTSTSSIRSQSP